MVIEILSTFARSLSPTKTASSSFVNGSSTANSSPPYLAGISDSRRASLMIPATVLKTSSPAACPYVSFTLLKKSMSIIIAQSGLSCLFAIAISCPRRVSNCLRLLRLVSASKVAYCNIVEYVFALLIVAAA